MKQAVKDATSKPSKARGSYRHVDAGTQVMIAQYACEHGNYVPLCWVLTSKSSSVRTIYPLYRYVRVRVRACYAIAFHGSSVRPKFKYPKFYSKAISGIFGRRKLPAIRYNYSYNYSTAMEGSLSSIIDKVTRLYIIYGSIHTHCLFLLFFSLYG